MKSSLEGWKKRSKPRDIGQNKNCLELEGWKKLSKPHDIVQNKNSLLQKLEDLRNDQSRVTLVKIKIVIVMIYNLCYSL